MGLNLLRQGFYPAMIMLGLMLGVLWLGKSLYIGVPASDASVMPLGLILNSWAVECPYVSVAIQMIIAAINGLQIIRMSVRNSLYPLRNYTGGIFYLIIGFGFAFSFAGLASVVANYFIIRAFSWLIPMTERKLLMVSDSFRIALFAGIAILLYAPYVVFVVAIYMVMAIIRNFEWREWLALTVGFVLPAFLCSYGVWAFGGDFGSTCEALILSLSSSSVFAAFSSIMFSKWLLIFSSLGLLTLALIQVAAEMRAAKRRLRKIYTALIALLVLSVLFISVVPFRSVYQMEIVALPLSLLLPIAARSKYRIVAEICFVIMLFSAVIGAILPDF